ncbi:MAG: hypothetical protein ABIP94_00430 [Planctomycetota bacterium]
MDKRSVVVVLCLVGVLVAQEPVPAAVSEPLDLAALAKLLDEAPLPSVRTLIPADALARWDTLAARLAPEDLEDAAQFAATDTVRFAAAARILEQPDEARATTAGLLREIRACRLLEAAGAAQESMRVMTKNAVRYDWLPSLGDAAHRRSRGLSARLLREHPDDPAVGAFLLIVDDELTGYSAASVRADAQRRLGSEATSAQFVSLAASALEERDLDGAQSALAAMASAKMPKALVARRRIAARAFELRGRIIDAKAQVEIAKEPGLAGQIAHLRLLRAANSDAAVESSRELVAAGVQHALPFSVLAQDACAKGRLAEAAALLDRSAALPGRDALTVADMFWCKMVPMMQKLPATDAEEQVKAKFTELLGSADTILASDDSEEAAVLAWFRNELSWPLPGWEGTLGRSLAAAESLQRTLPASLTAYQTLLAAASFAEDRAAGLKVLMQPIPVALAELDELALLRASIFVRGLLAADRTPSTAELDRVLGDLERVQRDGRDAAYLRGVLEWWSALRPGASTDVMREARAHFAAAQRGPVDVGMWPAACALFVADLGLGAHADLRDLLQQRELVDPDHEAPVGVSLLSLVLMSDDVSPAALAEVEGVFADIAHKPSLVALHSAAAVGRSARGDLEGSRRAAKQAMQAIAGGRATDLPHDRGVLSEGWFGLILGFRGPRPHLDVDLRIVFWILPSLPSPAQLKQFAGK